MPSLKMTVHISHTNVFILFPFPSMWCVYTIGKANTDEIYIFHSQIMISISLKRYIGILPYNYFYTINSTSPPLAVTSTVVCWVKSSLTIYYFKASPLIIGMLLLCFFSLRNIIVRQHVIVCCFALYRMSQDRRVSQQINSQLSSNRGNMVIVIAA